MASTLRRFARGRIRHRKGQVVRTNNFKKLEPFEIKVHFDEIIGHNECKKDLTNILNFLEDPERYATYGIIPYCKYLFVGPEGIGKSTLACAIAKKANVPIYVIEPSFFYDTEGVLEQLDILFGEIHQSLESGRNCMLLFKNIEYFSGIDPEIAHPVLEKMVGCFRKWPQFVAFATLSTTEDSGIPKILLEPPAFSKVIQLSYPEINVREEILNTLLKNMPVDKELDIRRLALEMYQMSFGDIKKAVKDALLVSMQYKQEMLTYHSFAEALAQLNFGYLGNKLNENERLATARHEAGHVIAGYFAAPDTYKVTKVEILPRSFYAGITASIIDEEKVSYFRSELEARIISLFGGMASENYYFDATTTGVANDLQQATEIAIEMFKVYGMSETVGPICLVCSTDPLEVLNNKADREIQKFLVEMYDRTIKIIEEHSDALEELVNALLEKEVLYTDEVMAIVKKHDK